LSKLVCQLQYYNSYFLILENNIKMSKVLDFDEAQ